MTCQSVTAPAIEKITSDCAVHPENEMLAAILPLHAAGFGIHWLHPRTKRPIGNEWSTAPVASWETLVDTYRAGNNVGVRLGEPSALADGGYLHVFDIDIRVPELADEAWEAFDKLLPGVDRASLPCVQSGSGGESRHLYFVTERPFFGQKLAVSPGKHRDPAGKWHYDYEIELFGSGKQTALPPSIHPTTGKPYRWLREFDFDALALGVGPHVPTDTIALLGAAETATFAFEIDPPADITAAQLARDLADIPHSRIDDYLDVITLGQALHHQFGGSTEGYDLWLAQRQRSERFDPGNEREWRSKWRGFGRNRRKPVTFRSIREWATDGREAALVDMFDDLDEPAAEDTFDDLLGDAEPLDDDALMQQMAAAADKSEPLSWVSLMDVTEKGGFAGTLHNLELIMKNDPRLVGLPQLNEFTQETVQRLPPGLKPNKRRGQAKATRQLGGRVWNVRDQVNGDIWSDDRDFAIRSILEAPKTQGGYGVKVSDRDLKAAVVLAANDHAFHPVREYLEGIVWDGVPRVEQLFTSFLGAEDNAYTRDVSRLMLVGAVARIFEPGCKVDSTVILEGLQGKRKSTFIRILGRSWFSEIVGNWHDPKQMIEQMQGKWICEIPELSGFGRAEVQTIKGFLSTQRDRARLAYAHRAGEFPRQSIFCGSTNDSEYLRDPTGGRRFWPMKCSADQIDTDRLEREMDLIWAETVAIYRSMRSSQPKGELPLYLINRESQAIAAKLQETRRIETADDILMGKIADWLDQPIPGDGFDDVPENDPEQRVLTCTAEVWVECLGRDISLFKGPDAAMVGRALARVPGWSKEGVQHRFPKYGKQRTFTRGGVVGRLGRLGISVD